MNEDKASLGKSMLTMAGAILPKGIGSLGLLAKGADALADALKSREQRYYEDFCKQAYEGMVLVENGEDLTEDEFLEMLKLCLADIEAEKAGLYGRLASAIATQRVHKELRFALMSSLSGLTYAQVQKMRRVYIARVHELIDPDGMAFRRDPSSFLLSKTPGDRWDIERMTSLLVLKGSSLTELGNALIVACFKDDELLPGSIGERTWKGSDALDVLGFHKARWRKEELPDGPDPLVALARDHGRRVRHIDLSSPREDDTPNPLGFPCFVLMVDASTKDIMKRRDVIQAWVDARKTPVIASSEPIDAVLRDAFPTARIIEEALPTALAERTLGVVRNIVGVTGAEF